MRRRQRRRSSRRGVVLLVVLSLLVLFLLMGVTFIVVSGQYRDSAIATAKYRLIDDDPRKMPDIALYQLLRDVPATSFSSLREQSLLADLYGNDGVRVVIATRPGSGASNYAQPRYENDSTQGVDSEFIGMAVRAGNNPSGLFLSTLEDYYAGRVVTFVTGRAAGLSTRIVDDVSFTTGPDGAWGRLNVDDDGNGVTDDVSEAFAPNSDDQRILRMEAIGAGATAAPLPQVGDQIVINGQAFNGTGFGYDSHVEGGTNFGGNLDSVVWFRGLDGEWGVSGTDDDGNGITDDSSEAGTGDDVSLPLALFSHRSKAPQGGDFSRAVSRMASKPPSAPLGVPVLPSYGGADETWDAVDFQNNFLAYVPQNFSNVPQIIPSFHRPSLAMYLFGELAASMSGLTWASFVQPYGADNILGTGDDPAGLSAQERRLVVDVKRAFMFRPLPEDHPTFEANNPVFNMAGNSPPTGFGTAGTWDVDNDGDGIADSIWIDIGLPVKQGPDGRAYKPLVAILCRDLDGRINVNAHGSLDLLASNLSNSYEWHPGFDGAWGRAGVDDDGANGIDDFGERGWANSDDRRVTGATGTGPFQLPRGSGYGPAEISLLPLVNGSSTAVETIMGTRNLRAGSAITLQPAGQIDNRDDELDLIRKLTMPYDFAATGQPIAVRSGYGSPPDLRGRGAYLLDRLGHPVMSANTLASPQTVYNTSYMGLTNDKVDDVYEKLLDIQKLTGAGPDDLLFTLAEMERLLRPYDVDSAKLPSRLFDIAPSGFLGGARNLLTVHSSHIPTPPAIFPPETRTGSRSASLVDLYATAINLSKPSATVTQTELYKMMPFEFRRGERFDLNRPFGNGRDEGDGIDNDSDGFTDEPDELGTDTFMNGVVDEPLEEIAGQNAWVRDTTLNANSQLPASSQFLNVAFDHDNDDPLANGSRAIYARHLYCLMMLLVQRLDVQPTVDASLTSTEREALTAKRIAQWAINVVDFRDSDAIMTPFEYDIYPFAWRGADGEWGVAGVDDDGNGTIDDPSEAFYPGSDESMSPLGGWDVDGNPATVESSAFRGLVWGCEQPELLLTENIAFHDRRVRNTDLDDGAGFDGTGARNPQKTVEEMMNPDEDADQYRLPQGSAFFELYCARNPNSLVVPRELYNVRTNASGDVERVLDLGRLAPQRVIANGMSSANVRHPVWRLAIADNTTTSPLVAAYDADPMVRTPDTAAFDPTEMGLTIDRYVWFSPRDPQGALEENRVFYGQAGALSAPPATSMQATSNVEVPRGRYVVVGPRTTTATGLQNMDSDGNPSTVDVSTQQLSLAGNTFTASNTAATYPTPGTQIQPPVGVICAANPPAGWTPTRRVGLNISEPLPRSGAYYREPKAGTPDLYVDFSQPIVTDPADPNYNALPDVPFDEAGSAPLHPLDGDVETRTELDFRSVFLQRLADPTRPWNPLPGQAGYDSSLAVNPYISVDWSSTDLTVFNGDDVSTFDAASSTWSDPADTNPLRHNAGDRRERFEARQRNGVKFNIWSPRTGTPQLESNGTKTRGAVDHFPYALEHTLGFLNNGLNTGYASAVSGTPQTNNNFIGAPARPFPWFTWNDRPYVSPLELLQVPTSSPSRLLYEFVAPGTSPDGGFTPATNPHPYTDDPSADPYDATGGADSFRAPFAHLLNFFVSDATGTAAGNLSRLFDYVETPPPFVGAEKWYNPAAFASGASGNKFRPPFNKLSRFRDPGRINLNTSGLFVGRGADGGWGVAGVDDDGDGITDNEREALWPGSDDVYEGQVWEAIAKLYPAMDPTILWHPGPDGAWGVAGVDDDSMNGIDDPGEAGSPGSDDFRPVQTLLRLIDSMQGSGSYPTVISNPLRAAVSADLMPAISDMRKASVEATLLRSNPSDPTQSLFATDSERVFNDTDRNSYFRHQGLMRLSNLITSQSNVYATWITVGFFEVENNPGGVDVVHPDGYRLAQELGLDTGQVRRHRAFYLIDRSIPVGFEPGENHNVDRAILIRRFIE